MEGFKFLCRQTWLFHYLWQRKNGLLTICYILWTFTTTKEVTFFTHMILSLPISQCTHHRRQVSSKHSGPRQWRQVLEIIRTILSQTDQLEAYLDMNHSRSLLWTLNGAQRKKTGAGEVTNENLEKRGLLLSSDADIQSFTYFFFFKVKLGACNQCKSYSPGDL